MTVVAVDAGTSSIKAALVDDDATVLAIERVPVRVDRPHTGWAEQDMDETWRGVARAVRSLVERSSAPVRLLATTAQGDGCWLVDRDGRPTGRAILWQDARAQSVIESWRADGVLAEAGAVNDSVTFAGLPHAIVHWLDRHDPRRVRDATTLLTCNGWLHLKLTGQRRAELSDASVPFLDPRTREYSPTLFELYGVPWVRCLLPDPVPFDRTLGSLTSAAAEELGLPADLPVVMAPYDVAASAVGVAALTPGTAFAILGTTLCTGTAAPDVTLDGFSGLDLVLGDRHPALRAFPTLTGTETLAWAARLLGMGTVQELLAAAGACPPGADGPLFLPYLSPAGERSPFVDGRVRGSWTRLTLDHDRPQLARSVLEGLSMTVRDCLQAAATHHAVERLHLCGGGSHHGEWAQLLADVTRTSIARPAADEAGAIGAFLCGLATLDDDLHDTTLADLASARVRLVDGPSPDPGLADLYDERYRDFVAARELLHGTPPPVPGPEPSGPVSAP